MPAAPMRFTTFKSVKDNVPTSYEGWDSFSDLFTLKVTDDKHAVPLYCPAEYAEKRRLIKNVLHVNFGVIDIDDATEEQVLAALEFLTEELNLSVIVHSTHSHAKGLAEGKFKCRAIIRYSRFVELEEYDRVWHGTNELIDGIADPQCQNPNAIYYFPSCPPGAEHLAFVEHLNPDGEALDIDEILELTPAAPAARSAVQPVDPEKLAAIEASTKYQLAEAFIQIKFPPLEATGIRNNTAYRVACTCGDFGLEEDDAWPLVRAWNEGNAYPLDEDELMRTVESAYEQDGDGNYERRTLPFGWRLFDQTHGDAVELSHLKALAKKMRTKAGVVGRKGRALERVTKGDPIGAEAVMVFETVADVLARHYLHADPHGLALLIEESIKKTHAAGNRDIDIEFVATRIAQVQTQLRDLIAEKERNKVVLQQLKIQDAFRSVGVENRSTYYSDKELRYYAKQAGLKNAIELNKRWVVRHSKYFYFMINGVYTRAYEEGEASNMVKEALAPARHIELWREGQNGPVPMKMSEIVEAYGTVASQVIVDLTAQANRYDSRKKTLVEAPRHPLRMDIEPKYTEKIEEWIRSWTEDEELQERILDWFACVPMIEEPAAALVLHGQSQVGKSLVADLCSRLWLPPGTTQRATDINLITDWTSILVEDGCPMVVADENLPKDFHGNPRTDFLRRLIVQRAQNLKRKRIPDATMKGCVRIVVAVNNFDREIIPRTHDLNNADIKAISERLLCCHIKDSNWYPREVLAEIRADKKLNKPFFQGDLFPQFVAWLHENRKVEYGSRLLVEGTANSELELKLSTKAGLRSEVCRWLAKYIMMPGDQREEGPKSERPLVDDGRGGGKRLLVTAAIVHRLWNLCCNDVPRPEIGLLERALGGVCEKRVRKGPDWYRQVDIQRVKYWAVTVGECSSPERFDQHLERLGLPCPSVPIEFDDGDDED